MKVVRVELLGGPFDGEVHEVGIDTNRLALPVFSPREPLPSRKRLPDRLAWYVRDRYGYLRFEGEDAR